MAHRNRLGSSVESERVPNNTFLLLRDSYLCITTPILIIMVLKDTCGAPLKSLGARMEPKKKASLTTLLQNYQELAYSLLGVLVVAEAHLSQGQTCMAMLVMELMRCSSLLFTRWLGMLQETRLLDDENRRYSAICIRVRHTEVAPPPY